MSAIIARVLVRAAAVLALILTVAPASAGNDKFIGVWKRDPEASKSENPLPPEYRTVRFDGDNVTVEQLIETPEGNLGNTFTYITDGEEHTVPAAFPPSPRVVRARWKGKKLSVRFERQLGANSKGNVFEVWKMKKKNVLEIKLEVHVPMGMMGTVVQRHVYNRYEGDVPAASLPSAAEAASNAGDESRRR